MADASTRRAWADGTWTHPPVSAREDGDDLVVAAAASSDAWRHTAYGFVHDSEHALVAPLAAGTAAEVEFTADFSAQFDQAGVFVRVDAQRWVKAGLEYADGVLGAGAVVTDGFSDWSVGAVPEWLGERVRVRVSRTGDALIVRAAVVGEPLRLLRVAPFPASLTAAAGPFVAAPTRGGLTVRFHAWRTGAADASIH
ncbi:DUF1349 domain-containing protein [Microbacterium sp. bgisy203]|uniref:DUF1349 domain-containing protein n=1 Tax=Microbacterium sp. bgisy203 TaxID=3413799 RepID=UPI003D72C6B2